MTILNSLPRIEEHRVTVVFDCPHCRATKVRGTAYDLRETIRFTNRVPLWGWSSHWVRCSNCRAELHANCQAADMQGASPTTVNKHVHAYLPFPKRFLAVASLLISWTPVVGVLLALIATATNRSSRGWPRWVSVGALALAVAFNGVMFWAAFYYRSDAPMAIALR